jgi:transcriptional regulator with XRE-family HTH domain
MEAIPFLKSLIATIVGMKRKEQLLMTPEQIGESRTIGERIARLRRARNVLQSEAAIRAGISRPTATLIEAGDPGRTVGQVLRYLGAIAPGMSLLQLLSGDDPSVIALGVREKRQRVRQLSGDELKKLDF